MAQLQIDQTTGLPIIPKDWLTIIQQPDWWNESTGQMERGQKRVSFTDEARQLLGGGGANFGSEGFNYGGNFDWRFGTTDPTGFYNGDPILDSLLKKTGEREGTRYGYTLDDNGNYVPTATPLGTEYMYTNNGDMNKKALIAMASVLAGGLAGNLAMTGNMFTSAAPGAMDIGSLFGAGAGAGAGSGSGALGVGGTSTFAGMSPAEIAAMIESGTVGSAGLSMELAAIPGMSEFLAGTLGPEALMSLNSMGPNLTGSLLDEAIIGAGDTLPADMAASYGATGTVPFLDQVKNIGLGSAVSNTLGLGTGAASGAAGLLSGLPGWARLALGAGAGYLAYRDAENQNGQTTGSPEETAALRTHYAKQPFDRAPLSGLVGQGMPQFNPTYTTALMGTPQFSTMQPNLPQAGQRTGYDRRNDFLTANLQLPSLFGRRV